MTPFARIVAVVAGIASLLLAGAALVRQAALATDNGVTWRGSTWWADLTSRSSTGTIVAAAVAVALTVILIVFAYRQVSPASTPEIIEFAVEDGTARLSVPALRKALGRRFQSHAARLAGQRDSRQQGRRGVERARRGRRFRSATCRTSTRPYSRRSATTCAGWRPSSSCGSTSS